jgi:osmotically inducible protein OsmC
MSAWGEFVALRSGRAAWIGSGRDGFGFVSTESEALQSHPYTVDSRFNGAAGTNPEELIAAAYASSFTMYLALIMAEAGFAVEHMDTTVLITLQSEQSSFNISRLHLVLTATIPTADYATFQSLATTAKESCAVSRLLNAEITMDATLNDNTSATEANVHGCGACQV